MSNSNIEDRVKKIIVDMLGVKPEDVVPEASFVDDLGADSLDTVELVMALEEEFETEIPDEDAHERITVNLDNYEFEVINVKDRRIERVILTIKPEDEGESEEESNEDKDK